jgi:hypothetical protein
MLLRKPVSGVGLLWLVIGVIVASQNSFLSDLSSFSRFLSAVAAVVFWPLVLLHVHVTVAI